jgi:hypothetical protein
MSGEMTEMSKMRSELSEMTCENKCVMRCEMTEMRCELSEMSKMKCALIEIGCEMTEMRCELSETKWKVKRIELQRFFRILAPRPVQNIIFFYSE